MVQQFINSHYAVFFYFCKIFAAYMIKKTIIGIIFCCIAIESYAQKTDTIIHTNSNILLGEIKKLNDGIISFKMDGMGTIDFKIDKVNTFRSNKYFHIVGRDGTQYYGSVDTSSTDRMVKINLINGTKLMHVEDIVSLYPIRKNFWLRTSGVFSLGFSYSKGSGIASLNTSGKLDYRNRKSYTELNWNEIATVQKDTISSNKSDITLNFQRLLVRKWYIGFNAEASANSELGLDLRVLAGFSFINYLVQNYHNRLYLSIGSSANREWANKEENPVDNLEGLLGMHYHYFKYTDPEIHITTYLNTYPNFSTLNRWRMNYYLDAKIEIVNDFFVGLNFYYDFDSKPISQTASNKDYGITTTISYSFH